MEVFFKIIYRGESLDKLIIFLSLIFSILYFILIIWFSETLNKSNDNNDENLNENLPFVSIIVAGHNEEKNITTLLKSLKKQTYNQKLYEILFVDDRSNDKTSQLVKENLSDNIKLIKIVETPIGWSNKKWALNQGIKLSKGQIIVQTDADCVPNEKWIETTVKAFSDENTGFVCGPSPLYSKNKIQRILQLENNAQDAFSAAGMMNNLTLSCTGRNMAFQKIIFNEIGGYEGIEHLKSGDDDLLLHKIKKNTNYNLKFLLDENATVYSYTPRSVKDFINQRLRFASKGLFYYSWKADLSLRLILPLLYLTNLFISICIIKFASNAYELWLLPWLIKSLADFYFTYIYYTKLKQQWNLFDCIILSFVHPFYVVIFGGLGPLLNVKWK